MTAQAETDSAQPLQIVRTVEDLRIQVGQWRAEGRSIGLVPTMGALHAGHISLVAKILEHCDRVIATVFVNPTQFGPNEDFDQYPRTEDADAEKLENAGAHLLFAPGVEEMYPDGFATTVHVDGITEHLCGAFRPGHFDGVTTVVSKLLLQALPDAAIFGEKDYQQLCVIRRMVRDLDIPVEILGGATVREDDGLAMSSRNAYLSDEERETALVLSRTIFDMAEKLKKNPGDAETIRKTGMEKLQAADFTAIDYLEIRDAETLESIRALEKPARILVAARLGATRLIDNVPVEPA